MNMNELDRRALVLHYASLAAKVMRMRVEDEAELDSIKAEMRQIEKALGQDTGRILDEAYVLVFRQG